VFLRPGHCYAPAQLRPDHAQRTANTTIHQCHRDWLSQRGFGLDCEGFDLTAFAEKRLGAAFVIAYVYFVEQMELEVKRIHGSCGRFVDTHATDSLNPYSTFGHHPDNHAQVETPPGPYIGHTVVCQCSPGITSMTVAGVDELYYQGLGTFVVFPAWALHRTGPTASRSDDGPSMWKVAGFFEPASIGECSRAQIEPPMRRGSRRRVS
jgi:hypothetical protein